MSQQTSKSFDNQRTLPTPRIKMIPQYILKKALKNLTDSRKLILHLGIVERLYLRTSE